jgi:hypothetical protein
MSELERVEQVVQEAGRRLRWQRAWRGLWLGVLTGAGVWLVGLGCYKLLPLPELTLAFAGVTGLLCFAAGGLIGWWRSDGLLRTARWLDERQQLKERLSTALELGRDEKLGPWREIMARDAAARVTEVDLKRLLPWRLPATSRWALLLLALTAGLGFVPEYRSEAHLQAQRQKESVQEAGRNLALLTRRTLERRTNALEATRQTLQSVGELGGQLEKRTPTRNEALKDVAKLTEKVQQDVREMAKNPALRSMERAARSGSQNTPGSAEQLQKQMDALQKAMGNKEPNSEAMQKLQEQLEKARQAAQGMMGKDAQANEAARENLAQSLSQLARQAADLGAALPSLEEAIAALEAGQIDKVMKDLELAMKDLDKLQQMAQALQQLQQQAARVGKDLAEQLEKGQADAAVETLRKMINQLKAGNLTPEQLKQLMEEVAKAAKPGEEYGKVGELLKNAAGQMRRGDQPGAAQSLADAAKELESLMQQLADAQDLQSTLDALKRAQMCIGNSLSWGQCNQPGRPGFKPGGKPGRGVGTWADESTFLDQVENTGLWDNSDIDRPDLDPRGLTERESELSDALEATRLKGQFNPGSQMPSITLKGVSLKGQSTVAVQEAVTAAQSEAQAALSQEQIPRAYQGAVKDYFDDLKK